MISVALLLALAGAEQGAGRAAAPWSPAPVSAYQPVRGDEGNFWRYFYFWKAGVTPDQARADILECRNYAANPILWARIPERMPLAGGVRGPDGTEGGYGLIGALAFDLVSGAQERRISLANTRRCMGFKGYGRYGLSAALAGSLNQGNVDEVVARLVAVASGPEPRQPSIAP
jgi:hypothetical protein